MYNSILTHFPFYLLTVLTIGLFSTKPSTELSDLTNELLEVLDFLCCLNVFGPRPVGLLTTGNL